MSELASESGSTVRPPRLNGVIGKLEAGRPAFVTFSPVDVGNAIALAESPYDGVVFEMEHGPLDFAGLRTALQFLLSRRAIARSGSVAPPVTPFVRIPPNGGEMNQWIAKQVLDSGVYGVIWPHVNTVEQARNAVAACRYPRPPSAPRYQPEGIRGDSANVAARYWGVTRDDYYQHADVWPLAPRGELLTVIMCEDHLAIKNLPQILDEVEGIGVVLIGEGDLSQDLGYPRQYEHPAVKSAIEEVLAICQEHDMPCGYPHATPKNIERLVQQGFSWLMAQPTRSYDAVELGLKAESTLSPTA